MQGDRRVERTESWRYSGIVGEARAFSRKALEEDESEDMLRHQMLSDTRSEVSCDERGLCEENLGDSREQILDEEHWESLASEEKALSLSIKEENLYWWAYEQLDKASCIFS